MIEFDEYYDIAADEIMVIEKRDNNNNEAFPYTLSVALKNGKILSVNYKDKRVRDFKKRKLLDQIAREKSWSYEQIYAKVGLVEDAVARIDKRQLRIWRILSELLHLKEGDVQ